MVVNIYWATCLECGQRYKYCIYPIIGAYTECPICSCGEKEYNPVDYEQYDTNRMDDA